MCVVRSSRCRLAEAQVRTRGRCEREGKVLSWLDWCLCWRADDTRMFFKAENRNIPRTRDSAEEDRVERVDGLRTKRKKLD